MLIYLIKMMPSKTPWGQIICICLEWVEEKSGYKTFSFTNAANKEKNSQRVQPPVKPVLPVLDDLRERPAESELRPLEVRIQFFGTETNFSSNPLPKLENGILATLVDSFGDNQRVLKSSKAELDCVFR